MGAARAFLSAATLTNSSSRAPSSLCTMQAAVHRAGTAAAGSGSAAWAMPPSLCSCGAQRSRLGPSAAPVQRLGSRGPARDRARHQHIARAGAIAALEHATALSGTLTAPAIQAAALLDLQSSWSSALYGLSQDADALVQQQLTGLTPLSLAVIFLAGLATSLSPCTLSVLPLTIGYIGGYAGQQQQTQQQQQQQQQQEGGEAASLETSSSQQQQQQQQRQKPALGPQALSFAAGLATTLALLGVSSSLLGRAYGQIGSGLPLAVALVAIAMGLNLLEVVTLRLPSLDVDVRQLAIPPAAQAYLAGATFALAASPCSTPVLATLLAYVSATKDPVQGGALLLAYTGGYVVPLLAAASATGAVKQLLGLRQYSAWVTPASGVLLVAGGTYALLSRVVPA